MPNVMANATAFFRQQSAYVPAMRYSADVNWNGGTRVDFGMPAAANATLIANAISIAATGTTDLTGVTEFPEPYGRTLTTVLSGAGTPTITINGWDYLGQPITENFVSTGATPVVGKKAFKSVRSVSYAATAVTLNIGTGASLGLPYKAIRCQFETANGALAAAGTLIAAVLTDPATAVTGDPRGCYTPTTALNGATAITATFDMINDVNAAGNGGLHGIQQFAA